ncbi:Prolyl 4-hydroxylase subunit alpha-3 [Folsomia candida]|uniref:Prolyl 4-hydroxylase subunit alpha-3 n=2 Tax=Folsomia candida TaxID=158441 RepID=A0A226E052_FOLCA|nr:Prolyl 4-hydroxylase subunit alpha-3 [Folsomia candida]
MEVVKNPIALIRMTNRFVTMLQPLREKLTDFDLLQKIKEVLGSIALPSLDDHYEAIESLLNLQQFYDLKPVGLVTGKIFTTDTGVPLDANHALEIGNYAMTKKMYTLALPWFWIVISMKLPEKNFVDNVTKNIAALIQQHDSDYDTHLSKGLFYFEEKLANNLFSRTMRDVKMDLYHGIRLPGHESYESEITYYNLLNVCNGRDFVTECDRKHLFCTFDTKKHPYFKINSVKLEILSWDPYVVLLHKAIPTEFFEYTWGTTVSLSIVNSTVPKSSLRLEKSGTPLEKAVQKSISPRNGVTHRIHPSPNKVRFTDEQVGMDLIKKMEMLTGLNIRGNGSDPFVVNSYIHGNPVGIHVDHLYGHNDELMAIRGHRLASTIIYMTDVEIGGGTAFPSLGFSAKAAAGSMLFWYGAHTNGDIDFRTAHEGCYAALGLRWVGVKFIRQWDNFMRKKCSPKRNQWLLD